MKDDKRATGRTTRLADKAIQTLFIKGEVVIKDHKNEQYYNTNLYVIVVNRLNTEHKAKFIVDRETLTIKLKTTKFRTNGAKV